MVGDLYRNQTMIVVVVIEQETPVDLTEPTLVQAAARHPVIATRLVAAEPLTLPEPRQGHLTDSPCGRRTGRTDRSQSSPRRRLEPDLYNTL